MTTIKGQDFTKMTNPELAVAYNAMVNEAEAAGLATYRPVARFSDQSTGAKRCEALASSLRARAQSNGAAAEEAEEPGPATEVSKTLIDAHVAGVERQGAEVVKLGVGAGTSTLTSETSKGQLTTTTAKGGKFHHAWTNRSKKKSDKKNSNKKNSPRNDLVILAMTAENPKKKGSHGARHWEEMIGKTVGTYLGSFAEGADRKTASQWLGNFVREGLVKVG